MSMRSCQVKKKNCSVLKYHIQGHTHTHTHLHTHRGTHIKAGSHSEMCQDFSHQILFVQIRF